MFDRGDREEINQLLQSTRADDLRQALERILSLHTAIGNQGQFRLAIILSKLNSDNTNTIPQSEGSEGGAASRKRPEMSTARQSPQKMPKMQGVVDLSDDAEWESDWEDDASLNNIPLFNSLGTPYRVHDVPGDGKCFFHAVCYSLDVNIDLFFNQLKLEMLREDTIAYPHARCAMFELMCTFDQWRNKEFTDTTRDEMEAFYQWWIDSDEYVDQPALLATAKLLFDNGIGLAVVHHQNSGVTSPEEHEHFADLLYIRVLDSLVLVPAVQNALMNTQHQGKQFQQLSHFLCVNISNPRHYRATEFPCNDRDKWTALPCLKSMQREYLNLRHFLVGEETHNSSFNTDLWNPCEPHEMCTPQGAIRGPRHTGRRRREVIQGPYVENRNPSFLRSSIS